MKLRLLIAVVMGLAACDGPVDAVVYGERLFSDPSFSDSKFNTFSCATCHATTADAGGALFSGLPLDDALHRASWWGGDATTLLDAVNHCAFYFMRSAPISRDDARGRALYEYLATLSPGAPGQPARPLTLVENVTDLGRGDVARGAQVWDAACASCHGAPHTGAGRMSDLVSLVPEASIEFADEVAANTGGVPRPDLVVIEKVRHGQFFGVGGNMPFFSKEALSDDDLAALLAFLKL
jgi:thiosulfate dehydrogenase